MQTTTSDFMTQYLSCMLGEEVFAINISQVREILDFTNVTKVPRTPVFMLGVINLRGGALPVVDLKRKFAMGMSHRTVNTCIIVVEVELDGQTVALGLMVDAVREVFDLFEDEIEPAPQIGTMLSTGFIKGMGRKDGEFVLLLDIDKVFSEHELSLAWAGPQTVRRRSDGGINGMELCDER